ncbi:MAG: D-alanyl-D-alanine carboxypeptidase [Alphaproteobacteria bacterium]|nr:D-alanyl-D-alanine carboxypeptidase [Alphaproteobacteria bacterium]
MLVCAVAIALGVGTQARAAPYAAMVMDARDGRVLYERNADARLHPASLTKMMTLYIAFDAIERGEISVDQMVTISANAAREPRSKLGLRTGQKISLRHLIRAAALRSANDAATAIGEAISGSEAAFADRMTRTARALGMRSTTFRNAHGLTADGHLSTARDMTVLGRRLIYDFPDYYTIFGRIEDSAGIARVTNTNHRLLTSYRGADGIKTGFTVAAGYNLTASAQRGQERIVATVFGGNSIIWRNSKITELLDIGFREAPDRVAVQIARVDLSGVARGRSVPDAPAAPVGVRQAVLIPPPRPVRVAAPAAVVAEAAPAPAPADPASAAPAEAVPAADVAEALAAAPPPEGIDAAVAAAVAGIASALPEGPAPTVVAVVRDPVPVPPPRPGVVVMTARATAPEGTQAAQAAAMPLGADTPQASAAETTDAVLASAEAPAPAPAVVTRVSTSGARHWGVTLGRFTSRAAAERVLLQMALSEPVALDGALRKVVSDSGGFEANYLGLGQEQADLACRRLQARAMSCFVLGP